jgi:molybdopterin/thiamine biosynthesis adenylyltransferase
LGYIRRNTVEDLLYNRQVQLELHYPYSVTVVGVGGIGSWVAIFAGMSGVSHIALFDPDVMEEHNRNRLPFCQGSIGKPKVEVVSDYIKSIRPEAEVLGFQTKLTEELFSATIKNTSTEVVLECTDSPKSQIELYNLCLAYNISFIRGGYDGTHITVTSNVSGWVQPTEEETYTVAPSWVVPSVITAALVVGKMMKYTDQEVSLDISEIGIPVLKKKSRLTQRCKQAYTEQTIVRADLADE